MMNMSSSGAGFFGIPRSPLAASSVVRSTVLFPSFFPGRVLIGPAPSLSGDNKTVNVTL